MADGGHPCNGIWYCAFRLGGAARPRLLTVLCSSSTMEAGALTDLVAGALRVAGATVPNVGQSGKKDWYDDHHGYA